LIGLIVTDISNPFYANIARIVEDRANELNYTVLISSTDENFENTERLIEVMQNKGVEGLIVVPCDGSRELIKGLYESNFPVVLLDRYFPGIDVSSSCLDNFRATTLATTHLIEQGHRKISLIAYDTEMYHILDRIAGYEDTMKKAGFEVYIDVQKVNILNSKPGILDALQNMVHEKHIDAVIFLTNMLAINGLYSLNEMGVKIPNDLAVIGFNRNVAFDLHYSKITFIKQPIEKIAEQAINTLVSRIKNRNHLLKSFLEPELIVQESSLRAS
jgi:LacI family transcriptional regulator